ncbi:MAG: UvrD-helicase domain-containing protein [Planctomycetaceae bacterium]|nr:UvrD-helicase domain-containing protein [Planctomycetaceae bacterium]
MDGITAALTDSQRQAVQHVAGPLLILAGPGSGKTRVVTHRVAHMRAQGIADERIVALTFTNKAADEMRARLERLAPGSRVWMGTFHRFCARLLRQYASLVGLRENYSIYDAEDSLKLLREALDELDLELIHATPSRVAAAISWAKNNLIGPEDYEAAVGSPIGSVVAKVYPVYEQRLVAANAVDFDDLLAHVARLLRDNAELRAMLDERFEYILVDEYQDTNLAQYAIVRALSIDHPNLAATGDPDQSIYGWRGATIRNILEFEQDFPSVTVVRLEKNYRSTKCILRAADRLIAHNAERKEKTLYTDNPEGRPVRVVVYPTGRDEADGIAARIANEVAAGLRRPRDYAIFYRTNALSRALERALKSVRMPYQIARGLEFYQRKEIKDILAYLHLLCNPASDIAFLRVINTPPRRIGKTAVAHLKRHAAHHRIPLLSAAREAGLIESLAKRTAVEIARFIALYDAMRLAGDEKVEEVIERVFHHTKYREWVAASDSEEDQQRVENLDELLTDAREFDEAHVEDGGLEAFLEQASLVSDVDDWNTETDRVTMMTLHAAKGLEFPVVFIVAVEDNLLPHERSQEHPHQVEEERRLLFVGMTRAKEELHLSVAQLRTLRGNQNPAAASPFLFELPTDELELVGTLGAGATCVGDWSEADDLPAYDYDDVDMLDTENDFDEYFQDDATPRRKPRSGTRQTRPARAISPLVTAAELVGRQGPTPACSPDSFHPGMVVAHPQYGVGKIVALSGTGVKRSATVQFAGERTLRRFRLAFSPLRPARE